MSFAPSEVPVSTLNDPRKPSREHTDGSLHAERAKTDASLAKISTKSEERTDQAIAEGRIAADEARGQTRQEADNAREPQGSDTDKQESREQEGTHALLRQERQTADEALEIERRRADFFLEHERENKRWAEKKFLGEEREETDKDLAFEREEMDAEVLRSTAAYVEEQESHALTKAALTTREEFVAIVSHDLRNPLGSISMALDLLLDSPLYRKADKEDKESLDLIKRNADHASRLIADLVAVERLARGKMDFDLRLHDISLIVAQTAEMLKYLAIAKSISIEFARPTGEYSALCDRDRINQVLANLITNAIKFSPPGREVKLSLVDDKQEFLIAVGDGGPGVPQEKRETIFDRFSQINNANRSGLGLGLYISRMIVEAHGGRIWVESVPGRGSTFYFSLPRLQAQQG